MLRGIYTKPVKFHIPSKVLPAPDVHDSYGRANTATVALQKGEATCYSNSCFSMTDSGRLSIGFVRNLEGVGVA